MDQNTLFFFNGRPEALPLYEAFEKRLLSELEGVVVQPQKSQITLKNRRLDSLRVDKASEPYPGRWTHHLVIGATDEIDDELMAWVREAYDFAAAKR